MSWIMTFTGKKVDLLDPRPDQICIEDIAHGLAHVCRFAGHTKFFYSVGQHSIWVAQLSCPVHRLHGLLHDAAEAYIGDVARPLKRLSQMSGYCSIESRFKSTINEAFNLPPIDCDCVASADERMMATEAFLLMPSAIQEYSFVGSRVPHITRLAGYQPSEVERMFLYEYERWTRRGQ